MIIEEPQGEPVLAKELEQARKLVVECKDGLFEELKKLKKDPNQVTGAKRVKSANNEYCQALNDLSRIERELGKHSSAIRGVLQGGALDLDAARTEVLERIARFRERA